MARVAFVRRRTATVVDPSARDLRNETRTPPCLVNSLYSDYLFFFFSLKNICFTIMMCMFLFFPSFLFLFDMCLTCFQFVFLWLRYVCPQVQVAAGRRVQASQAIRSASSSKAAGASLPRRPPLPTTRVAKRRQHRRHVWAARLIWLCPANTSRAAVSFALTLRGVRTEKEKEKVAASRPRRHPRRPRVTPRRRLRHHVRAAWFVWHRPLPPIMPTLPLRPPQPPLRPPLRGIRRPLRA